MGTVLLPRDPALQSAARPRRTLLVSEHAGLKQPCCFSGQQEPAAALQASTAASSASAGRSDRRLPPSLEPEKQFPSLPPALMQKSLPKQNLNWNAAGRGESERHSFQASSPCGLGSAERLALSTGVGNSPRRAVLWWVEMSTSTATG